MKYRNLLTNTPTFDSSIKTNNAMTTKTINELLSIARKAGFEDYASFNEGLQHEILTCTKGKYSGEVLDIYWDYKTGKVHTIDYSTQFKNQSPTFRFAD